MKFPFLHEILQEFSVNTVSLNVIQLIFLKSQMKEWTFSAQPLSHNCWRFAADNLWTLVTWQTMAVLHCTELIWTLFNPCEKKEFRTNLGRCQSCIWNSTWGCLHSCKLWILYSVEFRVCPDQKTALQECLMPSLIPIMQEMSTIALLHGCWCLLHVWSGVLKLNLFVEIFRSGWIFCSRIHCHSVNSLIWCIVYPVSVARCAFGDQMKTEGVTQGANVQVAGYRAWRCNLRQPWPP